MIKDDIIKLAREAGLQPYYDGRSTGMTLRDYFAAKAMQACIALAAK